MQHPEELSGAALDMLLLPPPPSDSHTNTGLTRRATLTREGADMKRVSFTLSLPPSLPHPPPPALSPSLSYTHTHTQHPEELSEAGLDMLLKLKTLPEVKLKSLPALSQTEDPP